MGPPHAKMWSQLLPGASPVSQKKWVKIETGANLGFFGERELGGTLCENGRQL